MAMAAAGGGGGGGGGGDTAWVGKRPLRRLGGMADALSIASDLGLSVPQEMLRPIPVALASCTRYFKAISAMRESIDALHRLCVGSSSPVTPSKDPSWMSDQGDSECATPPPWNANYSMEEPNSDDVVICTRTRLDQLEYSVEDPDFGGSSDAGQSDHDGLKQRWLSWPPSSVTHNMV